MNVLLIHTVHTTFPCVRLAFLINGVIYGGFVVVWKKVFCMQHNAHQSTIMFDNKMQGNR